MNRLKMFTPVVILMGLTSVAHADSPPLAYDDFVGMTFWLISMGMLDIQKCWECIRKAYGMVHYRYTPNMHSSEHERTLSACQRNPNSIRHAQTFVLSADIL